MAAGAVSFVFLPGLDGTGILAQPFMARFPYAEQTTIVDYPRHKPASLSELAASAEAVIAKNHRPVFIAESFGGLVLLELLKRRNVTPLGIIFLATFGEPPKPKLLSVVKWLPIDYIPWHRIPRFALRCFAVGLDATDEQLDLITQTSRSVSPKVLAQRLRVIASNPFATLTTRWSVPCCYIQATADKAVPDSCVSWYQRRFAPLTVKRIEGGHFLLHTRTAQCIAVIEEFIRQLQTSEQRAKHG